MMVMPKNTVAVQPTVLSATIVTIIQLMASSTLIFFYLMLFDSLRMWLSDKENRE